VKWQDLTFPVQEATGNQQRESTWRGEREEESGRNEHGDTGKFTIRKKTQP